MVTSCTISESASLFSGVLAATDCTIAARIQEGYAALLSPSGNFVQITVIVLTLYVAVLGYRLMLGYAALSVGELVPHFIKIGLILALITSWPTYQALVFEFLFNGPEQLISAVTSSNPAPGAAEASIMDALQSSFDRITDVARAAWEQRATSGPAGVQGTPADPFAGAAPDAARGLAPSALAQMGAPQFASMLLWIAAVILMLSSVGVLLVLRIVLALLLLVGPLFIIAGLFASTRGLAEGWLRVTVRFALAPLFTLLGSAGLVLTLAPFLAAIEATPAAPDIEAVLAVLLVVTVFAAVLFQAARISGGIAGSIRLPRRRPIPPQDAGARAPAPTPQILSPSASRADTIVAAIAATAQRRDAQLQNNRLIVVSGASRTITSASSTESAAGSGLGRLGQAYRRTDVGRLPPAVQPRQPRP